MASKKAIKTKKVVAKKQPAKRVAAKKKVVKAVKTVKAVKAVKKAVVKRIGVVSKALNKSQILTTIADQAGITKKQVSTVFDELAYIVECHLKKGAAGEFVLPGLLKCKVIRKPATKARKGTNPFTGEPTTFKAKPARNVVKIRPLKKIKEMVA